MSNSSTLLSGFHESVLTLILLRLPVQDLGRCKAVCKYWRSLITSPCFVSEHLKRSKSDPSSHHLFFFHDYGFCARKVIDGTPGPFKSVICFSCSHVVIVGSVNGLICFAGKGDTWPRGCRPDGIWIMNPLTGLSKKLPPPSNSSVADCTKLAFWCDDDGVYNVAKIVSGSNGATMLELWVSTFPDKWTTVFTTFDFSLRSSHRQVHACDVLIEGLAAYWIVATPDDKIIVVWLDFKTLTLKFNPLSKQQLCVPYGAFWLILIGIHLEFLFGANLNGEFVLITLRFNGDGTGAYYEVWAMAMDGVDVGWMKKSTFYLNIRIVLCLGSINGKIFLRCCDRAIAVIDLGTRKVEVFFKEPAMNIGFICYACGFVGSLVSMDGFSNQFNDFSICWPYTCPLGTD